MPSVIISDDDDGIRLDRWFKRHAPGVPHALLEKHLRKGEIRLDGKKIASGERIVAGQTLTLPDFASATGAERKKNRSSVRGDDLESLKASVLYKDDQVIVINKPSGLAVQGGTKLSKSVDGMLEALAFGSLERPRLVHRLDRDTSGALVLARTAKAAARLAEAFAGKEIEKTYWALVSGMPRPPKGTIDFKLAKAVMGERSREIVGVDEAGGKSARTEYRVLEQLATAFAWVELRPLTGRTHQLRVHMAAIGCPIVGDGKYGGRASYVKGIDLSPRLHLHARRVVIPAGVLGRTINVTAPLPPHMKKSWASLELDERTH